MKTLRELIMSPYNSVQTITLRTFSTLSRPPLTPHTKRRIQFD